MQARYTEDAMYMNMGDEFAATAGRASTGSSTTTTSWPSRRAPRAAFIKDQMQNNNPARSVELLLATGKVKKVGTEEVRASRRRTTAARSNVSELARLQSKDLSESELRDLKEQLEQQGSRPRPSTCGSTVTTCW